MIKNILKNKKVILLLVAPILFTSYLSYATLVSLPASTSQDKLPASKGQEVGQTFSWFRFFQGNHHQSYIPSLDTYAGGMPLFNLATIKNQSGAYDGTSGVPSRYYVPAAASAFFGENRAPYFYQHVATDVVPDVSRQPYHDAGPESPGIYYGSGVSMKDKKEISTLPPPATTPIPATVSLLGSGLFFLGLLRKRYFYR